MKRRAAPFLALAAAACAGLYLAGSGGDQIKFPHARHQQAQVDCAACHDPVYESVSLQEMPEGGTFFPLEKKCLECHKEQKEKGNCSFCHSDVERAGPWPRRELRTKLSHEDHLRYVEDDCTKCHTALSAPGAVSTPPRHAECMACHRKEYDQTRCDYCHQDLNRYPLRPVSLFSHQRSFLKEHARVARSQGQTCAKCHDQTFCAGCHASTVATPLELQLPEQVGREFIHRSDFVSRHALEARADSATCKRCHGAAFCESCHTLQNVTPLGTSPRSPHPTGWSFPASASFHGREARRDIASCAACHDQGARSVCIECHKSGGVGGNPHPQSWLSRHDRQEIGRNGMCLSCHL